MRSTRLRLLVAFFMLLLPLIYVGIIGMAAYGVFWHASSNVDMFSGTQGRGVVMVFLVYLTPMIIGGILVVFMFKPLFSRSPHSERWRSLTRDDQPLLFAFVERICDAVGAFFLVLIRFGLLAAVAFSFFNTLYQMSPLVPDPSLWYTGTSLIVLLVAFAIAAYAFWISRAGRPLFQDAFMEKAK